MAAKRIGVNPSGQVMEYLGTEAERVALVTTGLGIGSTFWTTDERVGWIWDGVAWSSIN